MNKKVKIGYYVKIRYIFYDNKSLVEEHRLRYCCDEVNIYDLW